MKPLHALALTIAGSLLILTYLLVQGATPDATLHERTLAALRSLILDHADLQRDVLRARAGLLHNYDPLVRSIENLRHSAAALRAANGIADGETRAEIDRKVDAVAAAVSSQEAVVEAFKARNALLQNSLNYFSHLTADLSLAGNAAQGDVAGGIAALGSSMLRFAGDPGPDAAAELTAALDRLERLLEGRSPDSLERRAASLVSHGRLIVATLPIVNGLVARLQADPTTEHVRAVQDAYLAVYGRTAARAGLFRILIYIAAVFLAAYVGYLFLQLRFNASVLKQRLSFEKLIASVSTQFINLPRDRINEGIEEGLARLAEHAGVDRAYVVVLDPDGNGIERSHSWFRNGVSELAEEHEDLIRIATSWPAEDHERRDCVYVPRVADHPQGPQKARLEQIGVRSWLSIPMWYVGKHVGFLILATVIAEKQWLEDDMALMRTASEIFANLIARERSESEREALEARLREAQRLEAIGTLAGGIAHEFNNILGVMLGYGEMAFAALRKNALAREHVRQIMKAGARAQGVVDQVLAFSRRRARQSRPIRVQAVIAEAIEFIRTSFPTTLTIETCLDAEGATVLSDPTELQQVLMNLCTNAAQAMEGRGTVAVGLSTVDLTADLTLSHGNLAAGRYLRLRVRDTGHGIEPAIMGRIFEPFFTTKAVGEGTGLGLATVHGIVTQHGGALNVESRPGAGTSFEAYFPQTDDAPVEESTFTDEPAPRGNGETILLVDDETPLVHLGEEMLAAIGYEPVGFDKSSAALAAFRADPDRFDLVLTDEVMPEMTGTEFATALHEIRPELPVVLMTGYAGDLRSCRLQAAGIRDVIEKPLLLAAISFCLARHLAHR